MQNSEFLPVPSFPLCPPKSTPFPQALPLISSPKGHAQALAWGLGHTLPAPCLSRDELPAFPCLCLGLLREHGDEPPSTRLLFKVG